MTNSLYPNRKFLILVGTDEVSLWDVNGEDRYVLNGSPYLTESDLRGVLTPQEWAKVSAAKAAS